MSPKSCLGCTKCFLFLLNLFFFFLGILLLAFSFWVLFDRQSFAAVLGSPLVSLRLCSYGFSGVGMATMLLGFLGCLGALKEVKAMLGLYFGLLLLLFAAQVTVAVIVYTQRAALATKVASYAEELIRGYPAQGPPGDPHESWDAVQQQLGCCGWKGPQDWDQHDDATRDGDRARAIACSCLRAPNSTHKSPWVLPHGRCPTAAPQTKSVSADGSSSLNLSSVTHDPSRDAHPLSRGLLIPDHSALQSPTSRRKLIEEIKSPAYEQNLVLNISDFKEKKISMNFPPAVETLDAEPVNRSVALSNASNRPTSPKRQHDSASKIPNSYKNNLFSEKEASYFLKNVEKLSGNFAELQHHLSELTELLKSGKRNLPDYPSSQEPSFIKITCQKQLSKSDADESRAVLLCGGKLRLNIVQQIFNLSLVEMQHGSSWIILTADSEGFIPLMFTSTQEILIRDATAKGYSARSSKTLDIISSTEGCRSTSSESLDITSSLEVLRDCSSKTLDSISPSEQPSNKM